MERQNKCGIGQVVFSGREQLALVRPLEGVLTMSMLNYDAEIRKPAEINRDIARPETNSRKLRLAEQLIANWHEGKFDFSDYKDRYRQKVKQLIEARKKGGDISLPEEEEPEVINLMDALQRSVEHARSRHRNHKVGRNHHRKTKAKKRA
jgi:DNA end-binding protein Ku